MLVPEAGEVRSLEMQPVGGKRILVVEDDRDSAELLRVLLGMDQHEVRTAENGADALAIFSEFHPQIVLLDFGLPGMGGLEVARVIRSSNGPDVTLIALTGHALDEDRDKAMQAGFDHFLVKPINSVELRNLLR